MTLDVADPTESAAEAGLHYVTDDQPGITRVIEEEAVAAGRQLSGDDQRDEDVEEHPLLGRMVSEPLGDPVMHR